MIELLERFGFPVAIAIFLLLWVRKSNADLNKRLNEQDDFIQKTLMEHLIKSNSIMEQNSIIMKENVTVLNKFIEATK